ncbi:synemin [Dunckerocampus dactyliophorus]|uniref:synemin n=1 Tax=Dunckerocampus dactyliophorus TaxID=161453 RepID=UPI0024067A95|nr:synemin [Dunckerocampus dactyliophorus]
MLPFKRTFEGEKHQLQELNGRLAQYLSRTQQLERENARLMGEINQLRQAKVAECEPRYKAEMRDLRRTIERMSLEKSRAVLERERLWRELQMVRSLCSQQSDVCKDISGELQCCEKELQDAHKTNTSLQQRLSDLHNEYTFLEEAHKQEMGHLRRQVESRVVPIITQTYSGPPAASVEEVQQYARGLSEGWMETLEMYQHKVEEMEQTIKADQALLNDLQREKMLHVTELDKLRTDAEKQGQLQVRLEEELMLMQDKFSHDVGDYQMIIDQLERERSMMADAIGQKMQEHQHLLQVKMDLGMEVAAYRALLEGERAGLQDAHRRVNQHQRERLIDIKMPSQPYTPRTTTRQRMDVRVSPPTSNLRRSPVVQSGSRSLSRVIPISLTTRTQHQSPASRRDMISFAKAKSASSTTVPSATKDKGVVKSGQQSQKSTRTEEKSKKIEWISQGENQTSPIKSSAAETTSSRVLSPVMKSLDTKPRNMKVVDEPDKGDDKGLKDESETKSTMERSQRMALDSVSVEEIIEKVINPAGLEAKDSSAGESNVTYHVEKTKQEDGSTKTQIVLESKVKEEVDVSEDSALDQLLSQGVKKVSLDDIEDTATGSMIKNLLSGLQGEGNLQNRSVNVEIIEQAVESSSDDIAEKCFYEPSSYFQIEEMENDQDDQSADDGMKMMVDCKGGSVEVQEVIKESEALYFTHDQEHDEYFASTPDDLSEPEETCGITSYGHYGIVDDLSDERYYQDDKPPQSRTIIEEHSDYKFTPGERPFLRESIPECIIEEEIRVSPIVQESVLELLRGDSLAPKEQLRGALEKLQGSVSGPLREELAFLTKVSSENPQNVAFDIKKMQQSSDSGTTTIVAELNVSQTLEDSGLLDDDDLSEEQILEALRSSHMGSDLQGAAGEGYSFRISKEQHVMLNDEFDFAREGESMSTVTERQIKQGPSEKMLHFQMEGHSSHTDATADQE